MKVIALAKDLDSLEKLINEYFYSIGYEVIILNRYERVEGKDKTKLEFKLENKRFNIDYMKDINKHFIIRYKKGIYYFYRNEKE